MRVYLGLGSNVGDRAAALRSAVAALEERGIRIARRSPVYETEPVGGPLQPPYLNQVVEAETALEAREVLGAARDVEAAAGREPETDRVRWGPRPLDVDVLVAGDLVLDEPDLVLPHPRIPERAFVLVPLNDLAPDLEIPGMGRVRDLLARLHGRHGIRPA